MAGVAVSRNRRSLQVEGRRLKIEDGRLCYCDRRARRGAALVEFAVVMPLLLLLVFGIIEFGHAAFVRHQLINAAALGARQASLVNATEKSVYAAVDEALRAGGLGNAGVQREWISAPLPDLWETVRLSVPYSKVSLLGIYDDFVLRSAATTRRNE